jgi:hypothetical protein
MVLVWALCIPKSLQSCSIASIAKIAEIGCSHTGNLQFSLLAIVTAGNCLISTHHL